MKNYYNFIILFFNNYSTTSNKTSFILISNIFTIHQLQLPVHFWFIPFKGNQIFIYKIFGLSTNLTNMYLH